MNVSFMSCDAHNYNFIIRIQRKITYIRERFIQFVWNWKPEQQATIVRLDSIGDSLEAIVNVKLIVFTSRYRPWEIKSEATDHSRREEERLTIGEIARGGSRYCLSLSPSLSRCCCALIRIVRESRRILIRWSSSWNYRYRCAV